MTIHKFLEGKRMKCQRRLQDITSQPAGSDFIRILQFRRILSATLFFLLIGVAVCFNQPLVCAAEKQAPIFQELAVPEKGAYTGAYVDFGEGEDDVTLEAIEGFEKMVGKHQAIIATWQFLGRTAIPHKKRSYRYQLRRSSPALLVPLG